MPVLPFLEDTEENVLEVVERAAEAGHLLSTQPSA